ncbi:hypothetical protein [Sulfuricurvum sp.]|uniref:hypothetical protein n=1 Tax=Sulfuricurvum sp. TaxID=2025608 RepID=UPI00260EFC27|nr:hypothetical protein [Sulfuricurvum sp.]MDD2267835.1 hypothetical protein [Sulfuricurvum sp.]
MMETLRGIKNLVPIEDYSLYFFILVISLIAFLILIAFLYIVKYLRKPKMIQARNSAWHYLNHIDFDDAKIAAYGITQCARFFVTQENKAIFEQLIQALEVYKYKPEIPAFKESDKALLSEFLGKSHV